MNSHDSRHLRARAAWALRIAAAALAGWTAFSAGPASAMGLLVPAYQYPTTGTLWPDCAAAAARVPLIAVLNPASGPAASTDPNYTAAVDAVRGAGGRVIGYIATFDGAKAPDSVVAEAARYLVQYALDGFFLDIMSNADDPVREAYYADLGVRLRALRPGALLVGNPGTDTRPEYMTGIDIVCDFEYFGEGYFGYTPPAWVAGFAPSRFAHLLHSLSTVDSLQATVGRAATLNVQWFFATHDTMPNPYDETPAYWNALVEAVEATPVAGVTPHRAAPPIAFPNPARGTMSFAALPHETTSLTMVDVRGRRVRTLAVRGGRAAWDGRDDAGRLVAPGLYFATGRSAAGRWTMRVTRLE